MFYRTELANSSIFISAMGGAKEGGGGRQLPTCALDFALQFPQAKCWFFVKCPLVDILPTHSDIPCPCALALAPTLPSTSNSWRRS